MSRRGPGEGTIVRQGDRWRAMVSLGFEVVYKDGRPVRRRIRKSVYGDSFADVQRKLAVLKTGRSVRAARGSVGAWLAEWLEVIRLRVRPSTYARYEQIVRTHLVPGLGDRLLQKLEAHDVQRLVNAATTAGLKPRTVRHIRDVLRVSLNDAASRGLVRQNPAARIELPRIEEEPIPALGGAEVRAVLAAMAGSPYEPAHRLGLLTGLRQGELLGLRWADVDLEAGTLSVRHALHRDAGVFRLAETKTRRSRRTLQLPAPAIEALRSQRKLQLEARLKAGQRWGEVIPDLVFTGAVGEPLRGRRLRRDLQVRLKRAGLDPMRWHDLRHGAASLLLSEGANLRTVMEVLGHTSITTTANIYAAVAPVLLRDAARRVEQALTDDGS